MKKLYILVMILFLPVLLKSHPASEVKLKFNQESQVLEVAALHDSKNIQKHFIDKVTVYLNGNEIITQVLFAQENREKQVLKYRITDAQAGDVIQVEVKCNVYGKQKNEYKIEN